MVTVTSNRGITAELRDLYDGKNLAVDGNLGELQACNLILLQISETKQAILPMLTLLGLPTQHTSDLLNKITERVEQAKRLYLKDPSDADGNAQEQIELALYDLDAIH